MIDQFQLATQRGAVWLRVIAEKVLEFRRRAALERRLPGGVELVGDRVDPLAQGCGIVRGVVLFFVRGHGVFSLSPCSVPGSAPSILEIQPVARLVLRLVTRRAFLRVGRLASVAVEFVCANFLDGFRRRALAFRARARSIA